MKETQWPAQTTPFPNRLLDEVMPSLKDTEWRLLCIVVRQTLGWQNHSGQRKQQDWLTHSQLKRRTNRASAAISAAVENLTQQDLVEVRSGSGELLSTPQERRRTRGRLYYRLHPRLLNDHSASSLESGIQKTKTTKEIQTKDLSNFLSSSESEELDVSTESTTARTDGTDEAAVMSTPQLISGPETAGFVEHYGELYRKRFQNDPPEVTADDYRALARHFDQYGLEVLKDHLRGFFESDFSFIQRQNYSLASFLDATTILRIARPTKRAGASST